MEREEAEELARKLATKPASEATYLEHLAALVLQASIAKDGGKIAPNVHAHYSVQLANILIATLAASKASPFYHFDLFAELMGPVTGPGAVDKVQPDIE